MEIEKLKYPIGKFVMPISYTKMDIENAMVDLRNFPTLITTAVKDLTKEQLLLQYRPNSWTIAQVVHHCADSHLNCLVRLKLMLTENKPTIKPYIEDKWAQTIDYTLAIENSVALIKAVHQKIVILLENIEPKEWEAITYYHPEYQKEYTIANVLFLYSWHSRQHLAHINLAKNNPK